MSGTIGKGDFTCTKKLFIKYINKCGATVDEIILRAKTNRNFRTSFSFREK